MHAVSRGGNFAAVLIGAGGTGGRKDNKKRQLLKKGAAVFIDEC